MGRPRKYSDEDCREALKIAQSKVDGNLSAAKYQDIRRDCDPAHVTLSKWYGNWTKAKEFAEIKTYKEVARPRYIQTRACQLTYKKLKEEGKCKKCGETDPVTLQFHHRKASNKLFSVSNKAAEGMPLGEFMKEVAKCDIVCANCHKKEHVEWPPGFQMAQI